MTGEKKFYYYNENIHKTKSRRDEEPATGTSPLGQKAEERDSWIGQ